jgi:hypothetical protein
MRVVRLIVGLIVAIPLAAEAQFPVRFRDATVASGIDALHHDAPPVPPLFDGQNTRFGVGAAVSDFDRDGDHDVYVCDSFGWPNKLFRNRGDGTFEEIGEAAGVDSLGYSHMALFVDLNDDGWDDLVVLNDNSPFDDTFPGSQLYRNNGDGTFTDVTLDSGFEPADPTFGGMTAGDYDKDGDLDLLLVGWYDQTAWLYRNESDFRFTDVTDEAGVRAERDRFHWTPIFADLDGDGWQDIFVAVDFDEDYLLHNNGDGTFTDVSAEAGTLHVANDMGVAVADFDHDLDLDLYTTNITGGEECAVPEGCNMLYVNDGSGIFSDGTVGHGLGDTRWGWGVWFFDADLDGHRDLLAVNGWTQPEWHDPAYFFYNRRGQGFVETARRARIDHVGNTRSLVPLDLEGDGDIDFLVFDVLGPATVYENVSPRRGHYLVVDPVGTVSNRNAVGARVYVTAGGQTQMHEITAGGSFYAGPPLEAHLGLGSAQVVDEVLVIFPSGAEVTLTNEAVDRRLRVIEPGS